MSFKNIVLATIAVAVFFGILWFLGSHIMLFMGIIGGAVILTMIYGVYSILETSSRTKQLCAEEEA